MLKAVKKSSKSAFSLVELSVVLLVVGLILAATMQGGRLVSEFKLSSARTKTKSSPITSIGDVAIWLDATNEESTKDINENHELEDNTEVIQWKNISTLSEHFTLDATTGTGPVYVREGINGLPSLLFDKDNSDQIMTGEFNKAIKDYTIFVVFRKTEDNPLYSELYHLYDSSTFDGFTLYSAYSVFLDDGYLQCANSSSGMFDGSLASDAIVANNENNLMTHIYNSKADKARLYLNKVRQGAIYDTTASASGIVISKTFSIGGHPDPNLAGSGFDGYIGEIIVFSRGLKSQEREIVEDYLYDKWNL